MSHFLVAGQLTGNLCKLSLDHTNNLSANPTSSQLPALGNSSTAPTFSLSLQRSTLQDDKTNWHCHDVIVVNRFPVQACTCVQSEKRRNGLRLQLFATCTVHVLQDNVMVTWSRWRLNTAVFVALARDRGSQIDTAERLSWSKVFNLSDNYRG